MALSRKHFTATAKIINDRLERAQSQDERMGIQGVADDLATMFKIENSQFDRSRFMTACGL